MRRWLIFAHASHLIPWTTRASSVAIICSIYLHVPNADNTVRNFDLIYKQLLQAGWDVNLPLCLPPCPDSTTQFRQNIYTSVNVCDKSCNQFFAASMKTIYWEEILSSIWTEWCDCDIIINNISVNGPFHLNSLIWVMFKSSNEIMYNNTPLIEKWIRKSVSSLSFWIINGCYLIEVN